MGARNYAVSNHLHAQPIAAGVAGAVHILVVEDDEAVATLLRHALLAAGYHVRAAPSAREALAALGSTGFDIAFFDIHLPDGDGMTLLECSLGAHPQMPVVMITGDADVEAARRAMRAGACDFISKPFSLASLPIIVERNVARHEIAQARRQSHRDELQSSYETVLSALLTALDTRDTEIEGHSERVTGYTMALAEAMGAPGAEMYHIERGALLHDIGKIGVPDRILHKPGPLTREEWEEMRRHPVIGHRMCAQIGFLQGASQIILHHHERWDGTGYPNRLRGEEIPLGARIFAVVDAFDAMTTDRPYRRAMSGTEAAAEIRRQAGTQFDPAAAAAFLEIPDSRWVGIRERVRQVRGGNL